MIDVKGVSVRYGAVRALRDVSLQVSEGEVVAVLGSNGAGKTSLLRAISGLTPVSSGDILFEGASMLGERPEEIVRRGVSHVPEGRRMLGPLTVRENLELASAPWRRRGNGAFDELLDEIHGLFPMLADRQNQRSYSLSGGEQQMLAVARGLMARPKVMLLDEPSLGLAPVIVQRLFDTLIHIAEAGTPLLVVEQNANQALRIADHVYILERGAIVLEGTPDEVRANPRMAEAYLGA